MSMFILLLMLAAAAPPVPSGPQPPSAQEAADRAELSRMSLHIRLAFSRGDIAAIMACHADAVEKSFQPGTRLVGKAAVEADLRKTLSANRVSFTSNDVETLWVHGDVAVEQTRFTIEGRPKAGGPPWTFKGRTQVVYVRAPTSPCGWMTIRELVQPGA